MKPKISEWRKEWKFIVDETIEDMDGYVGKLPYEDEMFERMWKFGESFIQQTIDQQKAEIVEMVKPAFEEWAGNSQYVTGSWTTGDYVEEERNDDYWNYRRKNAWEQFSTTLDEVINKLEER